MGYAVHGYVETPVDDSMRWRAIQKLDVGDVPRGRAAHFVFGYGSSVAECASLFKDRGLPADASETVREDYLEGQVREGHNGVYREVFGHSHVYARELPEFVLEKLPPLHEAAQEYDRVRLLVWFSR